jgi:hypothetical protein
VPKRCEPPRKSWRRCLDSGLHVTFPIALTGAVLVVLLTAAIRSRSRETRTLSDAELANGAGGEASGHPSYVAPEPEGQPRGRSAPVAIAADSRNL